MRLIAFSGPKGSGKDTAYDILKEAGIVSGKLSFAGPLKEICSDVTGLHANYFNDPLLKEKELKEPIVLTKKLLRTIIKSLPKWLPEISDDGIIRYNIDTISIAGLEGRAMKTPREMLQIIGTNLIRDRVYINWHVEAALGDYALSKKNKDGSFAITDARFLNELEAVLSKKGAITEAYYIERPESEEKLATATHQSELENIEIRNKLGESQVLKNDGNIDNFKNNILERIKSLKELKSTAKKEEKESKFRYGSRT